MKTWKKITLVFTVLFLTGLVLWFGKIMKPVSDGNPIDFWNRVCGVSINGEKLNCFGGVYMPRDGWYIYYNQGFHGQFLYQVERAGILKEYPKFLKQVEKAAQGEKSWPALRWAHEVISRNRSEIEHNPEQFLLLYRKAELTELKKEGKEGRNRYDSLINKEQRFGQRWKMIQRYWLNIVFEIIFFIGLFFFIIWPWLRKKGLVHKLIHVGLTPLLLFTPYYLGYAGWTFTSAGPSGGVLYPWTIIWFYGFPLWTSIDYWVLTHLPKILGGMSQPLGPMLSISGGRPLGPVAAIILGAVMSMIVWAIIVLPFNKKRIVSKTQKK